MADKFVTIARFENYIEADLAKQLLNDSEIKAFVSGENASNLYPGLAAELQVLQSRAKEALEILESNKNRSSNWRIIA